MKTMRISVDLCDVLRGWTTSALVLRQFAGGKEQRRVTIAVPEPCVLQDLRDQLDMIEADWKKRLGVDA
jgi:hypothetical protein